jgi:chromosome partitioning protein
MIVNRNDYPDAYGSSLGVTEYGPSGKAAQEIVDLWQWVNRKMEQRA